ncbi:LysR family transcriptional regulator substrate-binding protein [Crystallibacter crystallopoietes]|nr:LysR family transcriptional regulator substrate-binding protein [Arthrobacter crystallopoietes]
MQIDEPRRTLTIGIVPGVMPDKWIHRWADRMPDIPLHVLACGEDEQLEVLRDGRADMCFIRLPAEPGPERGREGLSLIPLYTELPVVVAPKEHELELYDDEVPAAELAAFTVLDPEQMGGAKSGVEVVASGAGVMVLPMSVARLYSRKDVISRVVAGHPQTRIGLAWPADRTDDVIEEFIGIVRGRTANSSRQPSARRDAGAKKEPKDAKGGGAKKEPKAANEGGAKAAKGGGAKGAKGRAPQQRQSKGRRPRRPGR